MGNLKDGRRYSRAQWRNEPKETYLYTAQRQEKLQERVERYRE